MQNKKYRQYMKLDKLKYTAEIIPYRKKVKKKM